MIRRLRRRHWFTFLVLAILIPLLIGAALRVRPARPVQEFPPELAAP